MIREVTMYQAVCDTCGKSKSELEESDYWAWTDRSSAVYDVEESYWVIDGATMTCTNCAEKVDA